jgi:alkanesulfonate monooxygenase SsuD/methylene tetrahydromethanopterin reductase-like flavin-dependent oxidoreductase (luciferase family)
MVELGVFLPVLNNGWIVSTTAPQYQPSYAINKAMTLLAEDLGFSFVLSPVKYRGFGGPTEQWDYVLESFEVMAALAEATDCIRLYGSVALPTVHPAITARRGATIDHIAQDRFGINLVSGWQKDEYAQMELWPGDVHYQRRYQYAREYVDILKLRGSRRLASGCYRSCAQPSWNPHGRRGGGSHEGETDVRCHTVSSLGLRAVARSKSRLQDLYFHQAQVWGKCQRNIFKGLKRYDDDY